MSGFDTAGLLESLLRLLPNSFAQASLMAKFVMGLLAFASLWSWVLICEGLFALSKLKRALKQASQGITSRVVEPVIAAGLSASRRVISGESSGELRQRIVEAMSRRAQNLLSDAEGGLHNLAVIASVAPFIGLFGTVYGIMTSFANIAEAKDTSLAVVAPASRKRSRRPPGASLRRFPAVSLTTASALRWRGPARVVSTASTSARSKIVAAPQAQLVKEVA